jgi:amino acid transporter
LILAAAPGGTASVAVAPVLAVVGGCCGAAGGAGVGAGLSVAESSVRSRRAAALISGAALGGALAGSVAQFLGRWSLATLVGVDVEVGGLIEGLVVGGAAGLGYGVGTQGAEGGLAAPRGRRRLGAAAVTAVACGLATAAVTAVACGLATLALTLAGRPLVGGTIHAIAQASQGSQAALTPIGRLIGEPDFGLLTASVIGTGEGGLICFGLISAITAMMWIGPRVTMVMGEDLSALSYFAKKSASCVPARALVLQLGVATFLLLTQSFERVLEFVQFSLLSCSLIAVIGVIVLRIRQPGLPRPFRVWAYPLTPLIFAVVTMFILVYLVREKPVQSLAGLALMATGLVVYALSPKRPITSR